MVGYNGVYVRDRQHSGSAMNLNMLPTVSIMITEGIVPGVRSVARTERRRARSGVGASAGGRAGTRISMVLVEDGTSGKGVATRLGSVHSWY